MSGYGHAYQQRGITHEAKDEHLTGCANVRELCSHPDERAENVFNPVHSVLSPLNWNQSPVALLIRPVVPKAAFKGNCRGRAPLGIEPQRG